ncbi:hypothetical protein FAZ95_09465 [Trinickia violacea]|uniref:Uncharacterized protein n=1 Tax=Trinickia violacea TaxID=2571746 RepID=A0A4P8IKJ2_9BURK|nr:hypothetical protein [Trinickia violacea]QCP49378.1 hypothetical protein FAZ95_09465 [Trinickia violacea]
MSKYFLEGREVPETDAASAWFAHAASSGIEISRAIDIWEDAATLEGDNSRLAVGEAGIRIEFTTKK